MSSEVTIANPAPTDEPVSPPPPPRHRKHTAGEVLFDWMVYGGIGWVLNTAISVAAADQFQNGGLKNWAAKGENLFARAWKPFIRNPQKLGELSKMSFFITTIYTGGTLLVWPMRMIENHKSSLVRKLDNWWHGKNVENDPTIHSAHAAMDNAPKQSVHSLISARIIALPVGLALGPLLGNADALSTKILNFNPIKNYNSFTRAGLTLSRNFAAKFFPGLRDAALEAKRVSPHAELPHEHRGIKRGYIAIYDLMLSAVVAAGFYVTSHLFAKLFSKQKTSGTASTNGLFDDNYLGYVAGDRAPAAHEPIVQQQPDTAPTKQVNQVAHVNTVKVPTMALEAPTPGY